MDQHDEWVKQWYFWKRLAYSLEVPVDNIDIVKVSHPLRAVDKLNPT